MLGRASLWRGPIASTHQFRSCDFTDALGMLVQSGFESYKDAFQLIAGAGSDGLSTQIAYTVF
jgi:hypothetical protein